MSRAAINFPALLGLAATVCTLVTSPASAAVIASQTPVDGGAAFESTITFGSQIGDTFAFSDSGSVTGLEWWGTQVADTSGFYIRLFDSQAANSVPVFECDDLSSTATQCNPLVTSATTPLTDNFQSPIDMFSIDFSSPIALAAGTYTLSIGYEPDFWFWLEGTDGDGLGYFRTADNEAWNTAAPAFSFRVLGNIDVPSVNVPEPGTLALLGLAGLGGMLIRRHRAG